MDPVSTTLRPAPSPYRDAEQQGEGGGGDADGQGEGGGKGGVGSVFSQQMLPTHTFATAPPLDVLIVPGGIGTRSLPATQPIVAFIRRTFFSPSSSSAADKPSLPPSGDSASSSSPCNLDRNHHQPGEGGGGGGGLQYLITVCTGAGLAARAGVLDGKRATTNKIAWEETTALGPRVKWVRRARWVRAEDGEEGSPGVWTSSGVSAGIDVTFAWMAEVYGEAVADGVARRLEYRRVVDSEDDPFADIGDESW